MPIEVWPFLVSRNRYLDYRTVVAPDFICDDGISGLLATATKANSTELNQLIYRKIVNSKSGDFTIVFQSLIAKEKDIYAGGSNKKIVDQFGREILLFNGVVINSIGDNYIYVSKKDIEIAYNKSIESYRKFWNYVKPKSALPSSKFFLRELSTNQIPFHIQQPIFDVISQSKKY